MRDLLQKIGTTELKNISGLDALCDVVKAYYTNNRRHKYSEISAYLMDTEDIEYLLENLRRIHDRLNEDPENEDIAIKVFKLIDHITLELNRSRYNLKSFEAMQVSSMNSILSAAAKKIGEEADQLRKEQAQKVEAEVEEFRQETTELKKRVEDSYSQFVSILGIFSAVVVVFFGGMTAFNAIFSNMQNINRFKLVFTTALVGLIVFDLIFMFLYVLAKLLNREIAASSISEYGGKSDFGRWLRRVWSRYPYMLMFNGIMSGIMLCSFAAWYGARYLNWNI